MIEHRPFLYKTGMRLLLATLALSMLFLYSDVIYSAFMLLWFVVDAIPGNLTADLQPHANVFRQRGTEATVALGVTVLTVLVGERYVC